MVNDAFSSGGGYPYPMTPVVAEGWAKVETFDCSWVPCFTIVRTDMSENANSGWGKGSSIIVEIPMYLCVCREVGIDTRGTEKVQGSNCL